MSEMKEHRSFHFGNLGKFYKFRQQKKRIFKERKKR
jgi:hypothetical protein